MPDQWGNEWMDDAVPSGIEIAHVMTEIRREFGWQKMWADCDGLQICPRVRVWLDGYRDLDYEESWLLKVWTKVGEYPDSVTTTDHLAIYDHVGRKLAVQWREDPRLFFDTTEEWTMEGMRWWLDFTTKEIEAGRDDGRQMSESARRMIQQHNREIEQRDRAKALKLGLGPAMPYLGTCAICGDRMDNVDVNGNHIHTFETEETANG